MARLGLTDDEGAPRVLPITFAVWEGAFVSAVDHKRKRVAAGQVARVRWLQARPRAALTVDRYDDDWSSLAWVQALGEVHILDLPSAAPAALAALTERYAPYRANPPAGPLLVLHPDRLIWWRA